MSVIEPIEPSRRRVPRARHRAPPLAAASLLALAMVCSSSALAQALPVPSQGLPGYVSGAQEVPDPGLVYKVAFDISSAGPPDKVHPALARVALYLNALAEYGVPPVRRQLTVVLSGAATQFALKDAAFAARNQGHPNPDAALIATMKQAGVAIRVGGEAVLAQHIAARDILPAVQVDLSALSTLVNLQLRGYVAVRE